MIVEKRQIEGRTVLQLEGAIELGESAEFLAQTLDRMLVEERGHVLVDFSRIDHIDSTGIGELVGFLGKFGEAHRRLVLVQPSDRIRNLLRIAQLDDLFPMYDTLEAALTAEP